MWREDRRISSTTIIALGMHNHVGASIAPLQERSALPYRRFGRFLRARASRPYEPVFLPNPASLAMMIASARSVTWSLAKMVEV